jgi:hypothetical protein
MITAVRDWDAQLTQSIDHMLGIIAQEEVMELGLAMGESSHQQESIRQALRTRELK